jgi:hypothetical protein
MILLSDLSAACRASAEAADEDDKEAWRAAGAWQEAREQSACVRVCVRRALHTRKESEDAERA